MGSEMCIRDSSVWMQAVPDNSVEVHFDGHIEERWNDQYHAVKHKDYTTVTAVPYDLYVSGKDGRGISLLRVWKAENNQFDMNLFGRRQLYARHGAADHG